MTRKETFYLMDTLAHIKKVSDNLTVCAKRLLNMAMAHDASKLKSDVEAESYVHPVWELNHNDVEYGSEKYKEITKGMGVGWEHHWKHNDHHIEWFTQHNEDDPVSEIDLFTIFEMLCDWKAAATRKGNDPALAIESMQKDYHLDPQLVKIMKNTLRRMSVKDE